MKVVKVEVVGPTSNTGINDDTQTSVRLEYEWSDPIVVRVMQRKPIDSFPVEVFICLFEMHVLLKMLVRYYGGMMCDWLYCC